MSIRAFSAQRFYALATGSPIDRSQTIVTFDTEIPECGVQLVTPDPQGDAELVWIHGVAALGEQRDRFISEIREGEIPTPLTTSNGSGTRAHVRYHAFESLQGREQTIASLLGLTETLIAAAKRSHWARCPTCAEPLPLFHTAGELCDHLLNSLRGKECRIDLLGTPEELSSWATSQGFTVTDQPNGRVSVRIDSLTCAPETLQKVEPVLASTKQLPHTWLTIFHENQREEYAWHGRCARCDLTLTPFNPSAARDFIERPASSRIAHEGCRIIDETSLTDFLSLQMERVAKTPLFHELFDPLQHEIIDTLALGSLTLHTRTTELAPQTLASVVLLDLARDSKKTGELRILKAPASLFSAESLLSVEALIEKLSRNSGFVWITEDPKGSAPLTISTSATKVARRLGSITLNAEAPINLEILVGQWREVHIPPQLRHLRIGALMHETLSGKSNDLATCELESSAAPYLVPLFPSESSGTRIVAHALGVIEPLAKMFAASHQAKMLGLGPRDFLLGQLRHTSAVCSSCKGIGVLITKNHLYSSSEPCHTCWGARFRSPIREVTFKGRTLWEILNAPLSTLQDTLRALPKMKEVFELASLVALTSLPLGMPVALLSTPQRRLLAIAHAMLAGTRTRPSIIILEEPSAGFSEKQHSGVESAITHPDFAERVSWIGVQGRQG